MKLRAFSHSKKLLVSIASGVAALSMAQLAAAQSNFCSAILVKRSITLNGTIVIDSFDSSDPNQSTNGRYDLAKRSDGGDIASASGSANIIVGRGNIDVFGHAATAPGGSVKLTGVASIGSLAWVNGGNRGIQPGWFADNVNAGISDAQLPAINFTPLPKIAGTIDGTSYTYVLTSGAYQSSSGLHLSGQQNMAIDGTVVLYFPERFAISGSAYVYITPGSSLTVYLGDNAALSGGGVVNGNGFATNCTYIGLRSCTSISHSGNSDFVGTIYAPSANLRFTGGGARVINFAGAVVGNSAFLSGNYKFHYDKNLCSKTVNNAHIANNDSYTTLKNIVMTIGAPGVLANDSDLDGDALTAVLVSNPLHGTLTLNPNGSFLYSPNLNYTGPDSFTYKANDGMLDSGIATVTITVTAPANQPPTVSILSPMNGAMFIAPAHFNVIADAHDIDGAVTNVQIFSGTSLIGNFTSPPYLVPQTNLPAGTYSFFATATDDGGLRATSTVVTVTVIRLTVDALGPIVLNRQNGLFEQFVRVANPSPLNFAGGVRVFAQLPMDDTINIVWNATGTNAAGVPYIDSLTPLPSGGHVDLLIQYYIPNPRLVPMVMLSAEPLLLTPANRIQLW